MVAEQCIHWTQLYRMSVDGGPLGVCSIDTPDITISPNQ